MSDFDFDVIWSSLPFLWQGLQLSLGLTFLSIIGGIVLGTLLALARLSGIKPLAFVAATYVNLIRSVPLILVIFWFYFLVPLALPVYFRALMHWRSKWHTTLQFTVHKLLSVSRQSGIRGTPPHVSVADAHIERITYEPKGGNGCE